MAIPDFQSVMRPILNALSDYQERPSVWIYSRIAEDIGLSQQELEVLLPSKRQPLFYNRIAWALFHMKSACLVESPRRGVYKLTSRGQQVLKDHPQKVDLRVLALFPEYVAMRSKQKKYIKRRESFYFCRDTKHCAHSNAR